MNAYETTQAWVYFKDGRRQCGLMINDGENGKGVWKFVFGNNISKFIQTFSASLIEIFPESMIEAIDPHCK